jgi:hypothetical protein
MPPLAHLRKWPGSAAGLPRASVPPAPPHQTNLSPLPVQRAPAAARAARIAQLPAPFEGGVFDDEFLENILSNEPVSVGYSAEARWLGFLDLLNHCFPDEVSEPSLRL